MKLDRGLSCLIIHHASASNKVSYMLLLGQWRATMTIYKLKTKKGAAKMAKFYLKSLLKVLLDWGKKQASSPHIEQDLWMDMACHAHCKWNRLPEPPLELLKPSMECLFGTIKYCALFGHNILVLSSNSLFDAAADLPFWNKIYSLVYLFTGLKYCTWILISLNRVWFYQKYDQHFFSLEDP